MLFQMANILTINRLTKKTSRKGATRKINVADTSTTYEKKV